MYFVEIKIYKNQSSFQIFSCFYLCIEIISLETRENPRIGKDDDGGLSIARNDSLRSSNTVSTGGGVCHCETKVTSYTYRSRGRGRGAVDIDVLKYVSAYT